MSAATETDFLKCCQLGELGRYPCHHDNTMCFQKLEPFFHLFGQSSNLFGKVHKIWYFNLTNMAKNTSKMQDFLHFICMIKINILALWRMFILLIFIMCNKFFGQVIKCICRICLSKSVYRGSHTIKPCLACKQLIYDIRKMRVLVNFHSSTGV